MTRKHTKRALFTSALVLLLCLSMLVGTTFAWFTDSVSAGRNTIQSGNLDIVLEIGTPMEGMTGSDLDNPNNYNWTEVTSETPIFDDYALYEPGYVKTVVLRIRNNGSLALKYNLATTIVSETKGVNKAGEEFLLSDYLKAVTAPSVSYAYYSRSNLMGLAEGTIDASGIGAAVGNLGENVTTDVELRAGACHWITMAIVMPTTVGNEANHNGTAPSILLGVDLVATQATVESDSFGNDYDEDAAYPNVSNSDELIENLENGEDVCFASDIKIEPANMSNAYGTTGINVKDGQTIDGNGHTLDIKGAGSTWDSGISTTGGVIKNITITGSFRGIFVNHNSSHSEKVILENVIIDGTVYTISCDQGTGMGLEATNSTFNGWTSYAATIGDVSFTNCSFGEGSGYAYCRPYAPTAFVGCDFETDFKIDPRAAVTFENCTVGGVPLTADNVATLVISNTDYVTVK